MNVQLWGPSINLLEQAMGATKLRQSVTNNNIANFETPYYKSKQVEFESILKAELSKYGNNGRTMETSRVRPVITSSNNLVMNNNHNDVDVEYEMVRLAETQIQYNAQVQVLNYHFSQLQRSIGGR